MSGEDEDAPKEKRQRALLKLRKGKIPSDITSEPIPRYVGGSINPG